MPSEIVDGNDVLAVYEVAKRAVDRARGGGGPTMIEAKTFRMKGHAAHDNQSYVPNELLEEWRKKDPIDRFLKHLREVSVATGQQVEEIDQKIDALLEEDLAWTESQPDFKGEDALDGVYATT
jgi:TPP-dependent pyruvate/acetoin dehydrogenase alpha subunit